MKTDLLFMNTAAPARPSRIGFRRAFVIREFECGLHYRHGRFVGRLSAGRHVWWGFGHAVTTVDLRRQTLSVSGQEVLTLDNVGLKVSVSVTAQVTDPVKATHEVVDWRAHLYNGAQLSLRTLVAGQPLEALLSQRFSMGAQLAAAVRPQAEAIGLAVEAAEIKDAMLPGELKKAFGEVLRARQEGLAALERARGEMAALRNLANAARLLDNNPALQNLRLIQSLTAVGAAGGTWVMGVPTGFAPLNIGPSAMPGSTSHEGTK